ncbi:F0F1 ATP synthase subunit delta [Candidatus Uhrbacteria bacterium]|nr:F0F1 ATP synthase subunit delta [Candidatus Uhrbacteria bacterium]
MKRSEKQLASTFVEQLDGATSAVIEKASRELVELLASRNEVHRVKGVMEAIETVWRERYGASTVTIETAYPITATLRKELASLAPGAEIREKIRPEIIGGARLRIDETIIDGSIEGQLIQLNHAFRNV